MRSIGQVFGEKERARQFPAAVAMATCAILIVLSYFVADVNAAIALISAGGSEHVTAGEQCGMSAQARG
ncbi:MAG: hypothetical protein NTW36_00985 [Planctomycetia bacterium]|nr:hypothetical protein [Planctomycetia bacterium]